MMTTQTMPPSHLELLAYWDRKRNAADMPARADLNPGELRAHLAQLSLIEITDEAEGGGFYFRLAGSGLRRILGQPVQGETMACLSDGERQWWTDTVRKALRARRPVMGARPYNSNHYIWFRAPLMNREGRCTLILCHDQICQKGQRPIGGRSVGGRLKSFPTGLAA